MTFQEYASSSSRRMISFDPKYYKANKELRLSAELRAILNRPPQTRSSEQIEKVLLCLRNIKSFAQYPTLMQEKLIEAGWYERHEARRIILRQGHPPHAFYIIISGSVVIKAVEPTERFAKTVCYLKRGDSFGELAILHEATRQSTVISEETVELLCISKNSFIDIFMSSKGKKNIHDPDFLRFISELSFLKGWPISLLKSEPKSCLFNFFRHDAVLVKDSNHSEWIYIIKSGSCRVLKKLREVDGKNRKDELDKHTQEFGNLKRQHLKALPSLIENISRHKQYGAGIDVRVERKRSSLNTTLNRTRGSSVRSYTEDESLLEWFLDSPRNSLKDNSLMLADELRDRNNPFLTDNSRSRDLFRSPPKLSSERKIPRSKLRKPSHTIKSSISSIKLDDIPNQKISIIDRAATKHQQVTQLTEADLHPCFVQVATLQRGDIFGLQPMFCEKQPSLSLVSNAAECLMISKQFYLRHCPEWLKDKLNRTVSPFPNNEKLQRDLETKVSWERYRKKRLNYVVKENSGLRRCQSAPLTIKTT